MPTALSFKTLLLAGLMCGAGVIVSGCTGDRMQTPPFYTDLANTSDKVDAATAAQMISQYRVNNGLPPVVPDAQLSAIAQTQADAMAAAGSVRASLAPNLQLATRMTSIGEPKTAASENVSAGYRTFAEAFSGWRESPKHNDVLLMKDATRLGIATAYSATAKHKVFWSLVVAGNKPAANTGAGL
ncbi:CAP domain-containing protein [Roseibium denhamense]|uniref:CAP domain-containing protein n=1 Tax=Roseibium denhamense TaxID=76305 RepID=UPI003137D6B2